MPELCSHTAPSQATRSPAHRPGLSGFTPDSSAFRQRLPETLTQDSRHDSPRAYAPSSEKSRPHLPRSDGRRGFGVELKFFIFTIKNFNCPLGGCFMPCRAGGNVFWLRNQRVVTPWVLPQSDKFWYSRKVINSKPQIMNSK